MNFLELTKRSLDLTQRKLIILHVILFFTKRYETIFGFMFDLFFFLPFGM